jgi:hypothetical protein
MASRLRSLALALWASGLVATTPLAAQGVTALEPERLRGQFEQWGYRPGAVMREGEVLVFPTEVDGVRTLVALGSCSDGRNCQYVSLVALYNDVRNPPPAWLNEQNNNFDFVTATSDDGVLGLRATIMLGQDGVPETTFRMALAQWATANQEISQRAVESGLARN